ncbi:MAG: RpiB/LacA/LacB family sugar-phosphate isomerase [bacterium]
MRPTIFIGSDHAGYNLKNHLVKFLVEQGYEVTDEGAHELDRDDDYPDFAAAVGRRVVAEKAMGILLCGNAEGICIAANKIKNIRAGIGYSVYAARTTREDDDANIICLPGRVLTREEAERTALVFLTTRFSGAARHKRRIKKVKKLENEG